MITSFQMENYQFVVIGGGISGVTYVESVSLLDVLNCIIFCMNRLQHLILLLEFYFSQEYH
jgi:hypothetical protein